MHEFTKEALRLMGDAKKGTSLLWVQCEHGMHTCTQLRPQWRARPVWMI